MLLFFYLIWGHVFSWETEGDPLVKLHQCSPQVPGKPSADIHNFVHSHWGYVTAKESPPCRIRARQAWVPRGTPVLYISSLRKLSLHGDHVVILDNLLSFCGNGNFLSCSQRPRFLHSLTHPQSPWHFFLSTPWLHEPQFAVYISSDMWWLRWIRLFHQRVYHSYSSQCKKRPALDKSKNTPPVYFHLPQTPAFETQVRQQRITFSSC